MYNRYIPQPDGTYRRDRVEDQLPRQATPPPTPVIHDTPSPKQEVPPGPPKQEHPPQQHTRQSPPVGEFFRQLLPQNLDTGDLMVIILLLLMAGDCTEDRTTALLTLAIYLLMQ